MKEEHSIEEVDQKLIYVEKRLKEFLNIIFYSLFLRENKQVLNNRGPACFCLYKNYF